MTASFPANLNLRQTCTCRFKCPQTQIPSTWMITILIQGGGAGVLGTSTTIGEGGGAGVLGTSPTMGEGGGRCAGD